MTNLIQGRKFKNIYIYIYIYILLNTFLGEIYITTNKLKKERKKLPRGVSNSQPLPQPAPVQTRR